MTEWRVDQLSPVVAPNRIHLASTLSFRSPNEPAVSALSGVREVNPNPFWSPSESMVVAPQFAFPQTAI